MTNEDLQAEQNEKPEHLSPKERKRVRLAVRKSRSLAKEREIEKVKATPVESYWENNLAKLSDSERSALDNRKAEYESALQAMADVLDNLEDGDAYFSDVEIVFAHCEKYPSAIRLSKEDVRQCHNSDVPKEQAEKVKALFTGLDPDWISFGVTTRFSKDVADSFKERVARFLIDNPDEEINKTNLAQHLQLEFLGSWRRKFEQAGEAANPTSTFRLPPSEVEIVKNLAAREFSKTLQLQLESLRGQHPTLGKVIYPDSVYPDS